MENIIVSYFIINFFLSLLVGYAALKKEGNNIIPIIISLILTPIIGFMYVMCLDSKEQNYQLKRQKELLSEILATLKEINKQNKEI